MTDRKPTARKRKETAMKMYRQGDVLVIAVPSAPTTAKVVERNKLTLALGEATGHSHTVLCKDGELLEDTSTLERWMVLPSESEIVHQEHDAIALPPGTYKVVRQREYSPEEIRNVQD
jgi:hypothetical protein